MKRLPQSTDIIRWTHPDETAIVVIIADDGSNMGLYHVEVLWTADTCKDLRYIKKWNFGNWNEDMWEFINDECDLRPEEASAIRGGDMVL